MDKKMTTQEFLEFHQCWKMTIDDIKGKYSVDYKKLPCKNCEFLMLDVKFKDGVYNICGSRRHSDISLDELRTHCINLEYRFLAHVMNLNPDERGIPGKCKFTFERELLDI